MLIFHTIQQLQRHLRLQQAKGQMVGFVPTMGALHAGTYKVAGFERGSINSDKFRIIVLCLLQIMRRLAWNIQNKDTCR